MIINDFDCICKLIWWQLQLDIDVFILLCYINSVAVATFFLISYV